MEKPAKSDRKTGAYYQGFLKWNHGSTEPNMGIKPDLAAHPNGLSDG